MKPKKIVLILFIGAIAMSVSALSATLAWYAASDFIQITGIDISVDTDKDLKISTSFDGEFKDALENKDLKEVKEFLPLTSAYSSEWTGKKSDTPLFYDDSGYSQFETVTTRKVAERGYFSQKLYLKSDDDIYVSINAEKSFIKPNASSNAAYADVLFKQYQEGDDENLKSLTRDAIEARLNKIINAMRFSLLITDEEEYSYTIIDPHKETLTYYGGLLDNDVDRYYDNYVKLSDGRSYERVYGEIVGDAANIVYDEPLDEDSAFADAEADPSAFNARHKRGVWRFNKSKSARAGVRFAQEHSIDLKDFGKSVKPFQFPLYRHQPREVVLSLYIEGWDLDSVNYTMGASFVSNLSFMVEREM